MSSDFTRMLKGKAATGEPIYIPPGTYTLTDEVQFFLPGQIVFGSGRQNTTINYVGSDFKRALRFGPGAAYHQLGRMTLSGAGQSHAGTVGVGLGDFLKPGDAPNPGTVSYRNTWDDLLITNFETGAKVGNSALGVTGSDTVFNLCDLSCKWGMVVDSANALNLQLNVPGLSGVAIGVWVKSGGSVFVSGGTSSLATGPIMQIGGGGEFSIDGTRVENSTSNSGVLFSCSGNPAFNVSMSIHDCEITGTGNTSRYAAVISGNSMLHVSSNRFLCCRGVQYTGTVAAPYGSVVALTNAVYDALLVDTDGAHPCRKRFLGNLLVNPDGTLPGSPVIADV